MIDLAILLALQSEGICEYGLTGFWNESPIRSDGSITTGEGLWVIATTKDGVSRQGVYTDEISVATRYNDPVEQAKKLLDLAKFVQNFKPCELDCGEFLDQRFRVLDLRQDEGFNLDSVDTEGRFVKSFSFRIQYMLL